MGLSGCRDTRVGELPTGLRRLCDVATVLVQRPTVLLLDEPTAGMPKADAHGLAPLLRRIHDELGCAMLVIEHDMGLVLSLADRVYALEAGPVIARGRPEEVARDPRVVASYLGEVAGTGNGSLPSSAVTRGNGLTCRSPGSGSGTGRGPSRFAANEAPIDTCDALRYLYRLVSGRSLTCRRREHSMARRSPSALTEEAQP